MRRLRGGATAGVVLVFAVAGCTDRTNGTGSSGPQETGGGGAALTAAESLTAKGRAPRAGYSRERFGSAWADTDSNSCDTRVVSVLRGMIAGFSQLMPGAVRHAY